MAQLADIMARARRGQPWVVTMEGESGLGKTALARHALASPAAATATRLWARADPAETDLDYGILGQLTRGVDRGLLARYPLLAGETPAPAPFAVGAQFLGLIGVLQRAGLVLVVIDDVQWADRQSAEALSFAFRRLSVDPVAAILTIRGDRDQLDAPVHRMLLSLPQRRRHRAVRAERGRGGQPRRGAGGRGARPGRHPAPARPHRRPHAVPADDPQRCPGPASGWARIRLRCRRRWRRPSPTSWPRCPRRPGRCWSCWPSSTRRVPLALLGAAAEVTEPAAAIQPALRAGLADLAARRAEPARWRSGTRCSATRYMRA